MWGQPFPVAGALDDGPVVSVGQLSMARLPRMGSSKSSDNSYTALLLAMTKLDARCRLLTNEANRIKPVTTHASWQTTPREQGQLRAAGPLSNPRGAIKPSYATPEPTVCGRKPCPDKIPAAQGSRGTRGSQSVANHRNAGDRPRRTRWPGTRKLGIAHSSEQVHPLSVKLWRSSHSRPQRLGHDWRSLPCSQAVQASYTRD